MGALGEDDASVNPLQQSGDASVDPVSAVGAMGEDDPAPNLLHPTGDGFVDPEAASQPGDAGVQRERDAGGPPLELEVEAHVDSIETRE